jgi:hypothetical protein
MEWTRDNGGQTYTATLGPCLATVSRNPTGGWTAVVSRMGGAEGQNDFPTVAAAQAWCETWLAHLEVTGQCA